MTDKSEQGFEIWLEQVRAIGGPNPLTNLDTEVSGLVNLERAHPVGLSLFTKSHRGLLVNLVRDPIAYSKALTEARRIKLKSERLATNFGIDSLFLLAGAVDFSPLKLDLRMPIVMWQAELIRKGADFELVLTGSPMVNPELILTLKREFNINLDVNRLLKLYVDSSDLAPITLLSFVSESTKAVPELEIQRTLVVTNATLAPTLMLNEISGPNDLAKKLLEINGEILNEQRLAPLLAGDADQEQSRIVSRALNGDNFAVETLPGTGYTQTVANILGALSAQGKRALVLAPRRQTLNELADRLSQFGLNGLLVRAHSCWLDLVSAISRFEKSEPADLAAARSLRDQAVAELEKYYESLHLEHPVLGISISQALEKLAILSALPKPPKTTARIVGPALFETRNRSQAIALLQEAIELGEFEEQNKISPWFNAKFDDPSEAPRAIALAERLAEDVLPNFGSRLDEISDQVHFPKAHNVAQWGDYLRLLINIRNTLDRFKPEVFDRPLTDLIQATSPRKEKSSMSGKTRRALSKHAKEYVRAGVSVPDLHTALIQIEEQASKWQSLCTEPIRPTVPMGIDDAQVIYQSLVADLIKLDSHLDPDPGRPNLIELEIALLSQTLKNLATQTKPLDNLLAKNNLRSRINEAGLDALLRSLAANAVRNEDLIAEFDQCWWLSALEYLLSGDNSFASYSPEFLAELESNFVKTDQRVQLEARKEISYRSKMSFLDATEANQSQTDALKLLLRQRVDSLPIISAATRNIWGSLANHIAASPYEVSEELTAEADFDLVIVMDAAGTTLSDNLAGIIRSKQIIAFGDPMIAEPDGFTVEWVDQLDYGISQVESAFESVAKSFDKEVLKTSYRLKGQLFGQLLNREFYQGRLELEPTANEFDGKSALELVIVDGDTRSNTNRSASTESPDAEVLKVVELITEHVLNHPEQSLLVVSASKLHVENLHQRLQLALEAKPELMEFFQKHGREKFEIASLSDLNHRLADRIIFTIGFGRTSHGKVLPHFGLLNEADAKRWLANMLVSARYRMTIVSCFSAYDLPELVDGSASKYLEVLLKPIYNDAEETDTFDSDPMLADLSRRLKRFGIRVVEGFGRRLPLVASYGNQALVVEPDWSNTDLPLTERIRLRPALLRHLGWSYQRVYSFEVFSDPQTVAERIGVRLGVEITPTMLNTQPVKRIFEDTDEAWGDAPSSNDQRLRDDKPPHWG